MGKRSRKRRARRAWIVPLVMPLVWILVRRVQKARPRAAYRLAMTLGTLFRWIGFTGATIRRNLELACDRPLGRAELRAFKASYYKHLALLVVELVRQPTITDLEDFDEAELARVKDLYDEGNGVIFVSGHAGLWELAAHTAGLLGCKLLSVAKLSGHPQIDELALSLREAGGAKIRDVVGSLWSLKKTLDRKESIGINVDQEVRKGQVFAPFFGIPAATSSAPALLHRRTGAPIAVVAMHRTEPYRYSLSVLDVIRDVKTDDKDADLMAITVRINLALEEAVRMHPEQWLWSHRRWRRRPDGVAKDAPVLRDPKVPGLKI
jgi:Kdo2-lipid IVA lauroyltransferase/acyltransferase